MGEGEPAPAGRLGSQPLGSAQANPVRDEMNRLMFSLGRSVLANKIVVVVAVVLFSMSACSATSTPGLTATPQLVATRLTAEVYGRLILVDDCLRVNTDYGTSYLLVWPPGFTVDIEGDVVKVVDTVMREKAEWRVGEMVWVGGGEAPGLEERTRQSVPAHCPGPYWLAGGLEMPGTVRNLILFLEFKGVQVESTDEATDHGFSVTGKNILADGERISVYEFANEDVAKAEAALVSADGFSIRREQGDEVVASHLSWLGTPHFFQKGRLIAIYVGDHVRINDLLEALLGPQFAGGD